MSKKKLFISTNLQDGVTTFLDDDLANWARQP